MSEESNGEEKKDGEIGVEEALKTIHAKIDEKLDGYGQRFQNIESKLDEVSTKASATRESEDSLETDEADETEYVTKKDLKNILRKVESVKDETAKTVKTLVEQKTSRNNRDVDAVNDYAMLNRNKPEYNPAFENEVKSEMNNRVRNGRNAEDSDLVYDSATAVFARWARQGKYVPKHLAEAEVSEMDKREGNFSIRGKTNPDVKKPNA